MTAQILYSLSTTYKACDNYGDSPVEYWQPEDVCHEDYWSYGPGSTPDDAPNYLFMGNDLCSEDITSGAYYTYDTDLIDHFPDLLHYDCDS